MSMNDTCVFACMYKNNSLSGKSGCLNGSFFTGVIDISSILFIFSHFVLSVSNHSFYDDESYRLFIYFYSFLFLSFLFLYRFDDNYNFTTSILA